MILVTHDLPLVTQVCERAVVMYAGRIAEFGSVDTLFHDPRHPYTRLLFEATPDLSGLEEVVSIRGAPPRLDRHRSSDARSRHGATVRSSRARLTCRRSYPWPSGHRAACHLNDDAYARPPRPIETSG